MRAADEPVSMETTRTYVSLRKPRYLDHPFGLTAIARALGPAPKRRRPRSFDRIVQVRTAPSSTSLETYPPRARRLGDYRGVLSPAIVTHDTVHRYRRPSYHSDPATTRFMTTNLHLGKSALQYKCYTCARYWSMSHQVCCYPGEYETARASTCRRCTKKYTSNEASGGELDGRYRHYSHDGQHRNCRNRGRRQRHGNEINYSEASLAIPSSIDNFCVIQRSQSVNQETRRSRSVSTDGTRARTTIEHTSSPIESVEHVDYVEHKGRSCSMSRSRGSSLFGCDRTSVAQVRRDAYDETEHYEIAEIHHCQPFRTLEFRYDGDYMKDTDIARPDFGPRSGSIDVQHGIPYVREEYLEKPRLSCSPQNEFRHCVVEESYEAETHDDLAIRRPTRSVHVLRSHGNTEDLLEREKGNEHERGVIRRRRGSFDGDRAQGHRLLDRYSVEPVKEPRVRFRRRELYDREGQNSHDHVYQGMISSKPNMSLS